MMAYVRLTFNDPTRGRRTVWAKERVTLLVAARVFSRVTFEGEATEPREIICLAGNDLISAVPATMNMHYGRLEEAKS